MTVFAIFKKCASFFPLVYFMRWQLIKRAKGNMHPENQSFNKYISLQ